MLKDKYGDWMTVGAVNDIKSLFRKATEKEIYEHLQKMAKEKGLVKNVKVKRLFAFLIADTNALWHLPKNMV